MRFLVLTNARSGTAGRRAQVAELVSHLVSAGWQGDVARPETAEAARDAASRARRAEHDVLVVAGGDGTVATVVNGLVLTAREERPALAILPVGRGNDFAAELGLRSLADVVGALESGRRRRVDLGRAEKGVFVGVASVGFDAQVARRAQDTPRLSGRVLYTYAVFRTLVDLRHMEARLTYDGGVYEGPITFAAVGNARRYGGGMRITPRAELDDGLVDLCLVRRVPRRTLVYMLPRVFSGSHLSHPSVDYIRTSFVAIETPEPADVVADGELLQETPAHIDVLPQELEVVVRDS